MLEPMADVRPFRALRYNPEFDLAAVVCPPFDTIPPQLQDELYDRSPFNAVRVELAKENGGTRYESAARTLHEWLDSGTIRRDTMPAYYFYEQTFPYGDKSYARRLLFARLRVVPWSEGAVLPHEQTFPKHKQDRLELYRTAKINGSPVFLFYRDNGKLVHNLVNEGAHQELPIAEFEGVDGQHHRLMRIDEPATIEELERAFADETLYVADGHHRYETALMYREEVKAQRSDWTGSEPENFALVGLVAADDPGMLVLPTHRLTNADVSWEQVKPRLEEIFSLEPFAGDAGELMPALAAPGGLAIATPDGIYVATAKDGEAVDRLLPHDRSPEWRSLDYAVCDYAILRGILGLSDEQTKDQKAVWFTEDAAAALRQVREGKASYAIILNPVSVQRVLDLADAGERMPQKSTFFYPKVPTGLVFNPLWD
jgi:uncharacterized protein (DUF1015 family)